MDLKPQNLLLTNDRIPILKVAGKSEICIILYLCVYCTHIHTHTRTHHIG